MTTEHVDLDALPLRLNVPDGWRTPHPLFISLYQGHEFPPGWEPYPGAPGIPPRWPWWEENGTSWYRFFRDRAPMPARSLGNWFSVAAAGLFSITVSPFALPGWWIALGGLAGLSLLIIGIRGVARTLKRQASIPVDPWESIRVWTSSRREEYFRDAYLAHRASDPRELSLEEFTRELITRWWGETP